MTQAVCKGHTIKREEAGHRTAISSRISYKFARLILGSWGAFGLILEATFKLYARPRACAPAAPEPRPFTPGPWHRRLKQAFDPKNLLNPWFFV